MPRLPKVTAAEIRRALLKAGWYEDRQRGGHVILKHPDKPGKRVTLALHRTKTAKPRTLQSILAQADLTVEQFIELL